MGKSKNQTAKVRTAISERKHQTIPISMKKEIRALSEQGYKYREIKKKLNLSHLPRQTFHNIKRRNYDYTANSRLYNSSYKTTDIEIVRQFESEAVDNIFIIYIIYY